MLGFVSTGMNDEFAKLIRRMNPPRVEIDNESCRNATVIMVDSVNKKGILLELVQVITDLKLVITKAYISSDCGWFMDVFNVTTFDGDKITDQTAIDFIKKSIETKACIFPSTNESDNVAYSNDHTSIELTGTDRPGLLSEVCAVLGDLKCNVIGAKLWSHNTRAAAIIHITDLLTDLAIKDEERLNTIKELLGNLLKGSAFSRLGKMCVSNGGVHTERRLHQLMLNDRDYERVQGDFCSSSSSSSSSTKDDSRPHVMLLDCFEKDYTVVILKCKNRPELIFDTICTITDMQYEVFHGTICAGNDEAYQEYYIRHVDGLPIGSDAERQRVILCIEAAIERRVSEGVELEVRINDNHRVGLLSEITRIFRENGLAIEKADISTNDGETEGSFHVSYMTGGSAVNANTINSIREQIGQNKLRVKESPSLHPPKPSADPIRYLFTGFMKALNFQNFSLVRSYS